jgi:Flp pilus assembly pilin Flp
MSATFILEKEIPLMPKYYFEAREAVKRLRKDRDGVVSFEYVIVVACIVAAVAAAFPGGIGTGLQNAITAILAQLPGAA